MRKIAVDSCPSFTRALSVAAFIASLTQGAAAPTAVELNPIGSYSLGVYNPDGGVAEIVAHDPLSQRLFVVSAQFNELRVLDIQDPTLPVEVDRIDFGSFRPNSIAVRDGVIAVAVENDPKTDPGRVYFLDSDLRPLSDVEVGALPDMLTFSPNGRWVLVANEGEPDGYGTGYTDPEGSVSVIDLSGGPASLTQANVRTASFSSFNADDLRGKGVRIFGPGATVAQDLEPEYIAVSFDSKTAWVTLQENNALATLDVNAGVFTSVVGLGLKDFNAPGAGFDPTRDGGPHIGNWPVKGLYEPDGIAAYKVGNTTFLVLANEGDVRDWPGYKEDVTVNDANYVLDSGVFPNAADLKKNSQLGRLQVSTASGNLDNDTQFEEIHAFGGRSFSIRDTAGNLVWDSGDDLEQIEAAVYPGFFNASHSNNTVDSRSTSKGPEPESVVIGKAYGNTYAFVALERIGGIVTYDISDPYNPVFVDYVNRRNFEVSPGQDNLALVGDLGPEGLHFIRAEDSPNGRPLVVVGNEVSGTATIFEVAKVVRH